MANERITGAQWEYLTALGERADEKTTKADASARIDKAKQRQHKPPTSHQLRLAREWSLTFANDATQREATDALYRFIIARRWVYSVARKMIDAEQEWRTYEESGLPEHKISIIAHAVLANPLLAQAAEGATRGSSFTGSAWNRYTAKAVQSEPYKQTAAMIQQQMPRELQKASKRSKGGCFTMLMLVVAPTCAACWM